MKYQYTGEYPSPIVGLIVDVNAHITRATPLLEGVPEDEISDAPDFDLPGSTVVLFPGDVVETDEDVSHGLLEPIEEEPPAKPKKNQAGQAANEE